MLICCFNSSSSWSWKKEKIKIKKKKTTTLQVIILLNTTTSGRKEQKNLYSTSTHYWFMILPVLPVRDKQKSLMQTKIAISRKKGREKQKQPVTPDQCLPNLLEESSSIPLAGTGGEKKKGNTLNLTIVIFLHHTEAATHLLHFKSI